jgi:YegS/Rv2252/BmrU family lipid kinase
MSRPTIGVVINQGKRLGTGLEELRATLADLGHADPPWYEVPKSKKAPQKVRQLVEEGVDRVLVWGGDGTVRRCIDALLHDGRGDDVSVGVLPAGTANLLALNLGIPEDLRAAVEIAVNGDPHPIDVGRINDQHFAVMAGAGFDAMMIRDADDSGAKDRFGRLGYVLAGVRNTAISPAEARISVDGDPWYVGAATCVIVGNVGRLLGGIPAFPDASPTDGLLDVGVIHARRRSEWARLLGSVLTKRTAASPFARVTTAEKVRVELDRTLPWEADGGDRERTDEFDIRCLVGAIRVCQPQRDDSQGQTDEEVE